MMEVIFAILAGLFVVSQIFIGVVIYKRDRLVNSLHEAWIDVTKIKIKKNLDELEIRGSVSLRDQKKLYAMATERDLLQHERDLKFLKKDRED